MNKDLEIKVIGSKVSLYFFARDHHSQRRELDYTYDLTEIEIPKIIKDLEKAAFEAFNNDKSAMMERICDLVNQRTGTNKQIEELVKLYTKKYGDIDVDKIM